MPSVEYFNQCTLLNKLKHINFVHTLTLVYKDFPILTELKSKHVEWVEISLFYFFAEVRVVGDFSVYRWRKSLVSSIKGEPCRQLDDNCICLSLDSCCFASSLVGEYSTLFGVEQNWQAHNRAEVLPGRGPLSSTADSGEGKQDAFDEFPCYLSFLITDSNVMVFIGCFHRSMP